MIILGTGGQSAAPISISPNSAHEVLVVIRPQDNEADVRFESAGSVTTRSGLPLRDAGFSRLGFVRFAGLNPASAYLVSHVNALAKN